jgi:hypothetical protein
MVVRQEQIDHHKGEKRFADERDEEEWEPVVPHTCGSGGELPQN